MLDAIGFIGGGSAMVVPPLLEDALDCVVINPDKRLGGHIHSLTLSLTETIIDGKTTFSYLIEEWMPEDIPKLLAKVSDFEDMVNDGQVIGRRRTHYIALEAGAEFIASPQHYPYVQTQFKQLDVKMEEFQLSIDVFNASTKEHIVLPPIFETDKAICTSCSGLFGSSKGIRVSWETLRKHLSTLVETKKLTLMAEHIDENLPRVKTMREFIDKDFIPSDVIVPGVKPAAEIMESRKLYCDKVLLVQLMAAYGVSRAAVLEYCANDAINYMAFGAKWNRAISGLSTYIHRLKEACQTTQFEIGEKARKIEIEMIDGQRYYKIRMNDDLNDKKFVMDPTTQKPKLFKYLMVSTNAEIAKDLLPDIGEEDMIEIKMALKAVTYYDTELVFHTDQSFVSPDRTAAFIHFEPGMDASGSPDPNKDIATLNPSKPFLYPQGADVVVKSWIRSDQVYKPDSSKILYRVPGYRHPNVDNAFRHAQQVLEKFQGKYGIYFGGIIAGFNDSHESALQANFRVAWRISQDAKFTPPQLKKLELSPMPKYVPAFVAAQLGVGQAGVTLCSC